MDESRPPRFGVVVVAGAPMASGHAGRRIGIAHAVLRLLRVVHHDLEHRAGLAKRSLPDDDVVFHATPYVMELPEALERPDAGPRVAAPG